MRKWWSKTGKDGFTIVELIIVITIIGILVAISIISYGGAPRRSTESAMKSDLHNAADAMNLHRIFDNGYPSVLPDDIRASPDVQLLLKTNTMPVYGSLSPVQNGVLYQSICSELINEGYGVGQNISGQSEQYVTGCNVYNYGAMQINGWNAHNFTVPVGSTTVHDWYDANIAYESYRPNHKAVVEAFADLLTSRFTAMGGTFPIASFWDSWATPSNGGVVKSELPAPTSGGNSTGFCIQATTTKYSDLLWHITEDDMLVVGSC